MQTENKKENIRAHECESTDNGFAEEVEVIVFESLAAGVRGVILLQQRGSNPHEFSNCFRVSEHEEYRPDQ